MVAGIWVLALGAGLAQAKQAAMEAMQKFGGPSEGHQAPEGREFKSMEIRYTRAQ